MPRIAKKSADGQKATKAERGLLGILEAALTPIHRPLLLAFVLVLFVARLPIIDKNTPARVFGTDQEGTPVVTVKGACQAFAAYALDGSWARDAAVRVCDPFGREPLRLPTTGLARPFVPPAPCADESTLTEVSSIAKTISWLGDMLDGFKVGEWLHEAGTTIEDARREAHAECENKRREALHRHNSALAVGATSALLVLMAHWLVVATFVGLLDEHAHLLVGGGFSLFGALVFAGK